MFCALRTGTIRGRLGSQVAAIHAQAIHQNGPLNGELQGMRNFIVSLMRDEQGQDLIEYALLAALISIFCIAAVTGAGQKISSWYDNVEFSIP